MYGSGCIQRADAREDLRMGEAVLMGSRATEDSYRDWRLDLKAMS